MSKEKFMLNILNIYKNWNEWFLVGIKQNGSSA